MVYRENAFNIPIRISYRPPLILVYLMTFSHTGALLCLFFVAVPPLLLGLLMLVTTVNYCLFIRGFFQQQRMLPCPQLCLGKENEWSLLLGHNEVLSLQLRPGALVHRLLLVLRFSTENRKFYCFILNAENVESNTLRRLRVRLLHGKTKSCR